MPTGRKGRLCGTVAFVMFVMPAWNMPAADEAGDAALSDALARVKIFAELTDAERNTLKSAAALRRAKAGERIIEKGQALEKMFIVMEGQTEVWVNGSLVATVSGQSVSGEAEFLNKLPAFADVIIQKETGLIELNNAALADIMAKHPRIGYVLMREMAVIEALRLRDTTISGHAHDEQASAAIDKVRTDFNAAYGKGDAQAMAGLIDLDAVWMPPGEPAVLGRDNIKARYAKFFANVGSRFELEAGCMQECGDWAFLSGAWNRTDTSRSGGNVRNVAGHYLMLLKKQPDGGWRIARDIWNELANPPE